MSVRSVGNAVKSIGTKKRIGSIKPIKTPKRK